MKKINFKNLPSTETPIDADNLNLLQNNIEESTVVVGTEQPTNKQAVWFKSSKNLFNKAVETKGMTISLDTGFVDVETGDRNTSDFIPVKLGTYYFKPIATRLAYYDGSKKFINSDFNKDKINIIDSRIKYLRFSYDNTIENVQLNKDKLSSYEPYVSTEIYTYNGNGYDRFDKIESGTGTLQVSSIPARSTTIFEKSGTLQPGLYIIELDLGYVTGENFPMKIFLDTNPRTSNNATFYTVNDTGGQRTLTCIFKVELPLVLEGSVYNYYDGTMTIKNNETRLKWIKLN